MRVMQDRTHTTHTAHTMPPLDHTTALPHPQQTRHHTNGRENRDNTTGTRQREEGRTIQGVPDPTRDRGTTRDHHSRHSTGPPHTRRGTPTRRRGVQQHSRPSLTMPPTIRYAAPPSTMAPPTTNVRGEQTEDTPPHEQHRHTLTTHTPHTRQVTVHDMTAVLASTAMG